VHNKLSIGSVLKGNEEALAVLIEIDLEGKDTGLAHAAIGTTQDGNKVVHQQNIGEEHMEDGQH
jgi:hypothetical protein